MPLRDLLGHEHKIQPLSIINEVHFTPNDYRYIPGCFGPRLFWAAA